MDRIALLEGFLKEDPHDPFNSYALALEYIKIDSQKAKEIFESLLSSNPDYLPTYYSFAQLLIDLNDPHAQTVFKQGIEIARQQNNLKTLNELTSSYNNWLFDQS